MSKKYLSGRVQRTPQDQLKEDRYKYLNLEQAEPNLGDPVENTYHDVTNASYNPTSGDLTLTIGTHTLEVHESIGIVGAALTFKCDYNGDNFTTEKAYPREIGANTSDSADYAYNKPLAITGVTGTTITVNVNGGQGAISDTSTHQWFGGTAHNAIYSGSFNKPTPIGDQYQIVSIPGHPGERFWVPIGGGKVPGALSIYDEGVLVGTANNITQLDFVGAPLTATALPNNDKATIRVVPATIATTPPSNPYHGELWWEDDTGELLIWYQDGTSGQWVVANSGGGNTNPGAKGQKGEVGPKGTQGLTGSQGKTGDKGEPSTVKGPKGDPGQDGIQGKDGSLGKDGAKGEPGQKGDEGIKGTKGDNKGEPGDKGDKGDKGLGDKGSKGESGTAANKGEKGDKGDEGAKGEGGKGEPGEGQKGEPGTAANKGDKGEPGDKGDKGVGDKGEPGAGQKGEPGTAANKGDKGEQGDKGDQNDKGQKGEPSTEKGQKGEASTEKGDKGQKGEIGEGTKGEEGDKGEPSTDKGQKGEKGEVNDKGQKGAPGADNSTKGDKGDKGVKGDQAAGGGVGGSDHDIQYNNNGSIAGAARLQYNDSDHKLEFLNSGGTVKTKIHVNSSNETEFWNGVTSANGGANGVIQKFKSDGIWTPTKMYCYTSPSQSQDQGALGELAMSGGTGVQGWAWVAQTIVNAHGRATVFGPGSHSHTCDLSNFGYFIIILTGGGGSGGEGSANAGGGGGGSAGTVVQFGGHMMVGVTPTVTMSIASGGSAVSSGNGSNGGNSVVTTNGGSSYSMYAYGGGGGIGNQSSINGGGHAGNASGSGGSHSYSVVANGAFGGVGHSANYLRGFGGPSFWGGPNGTNFNAKGAPGSGGTGSQNGVTSQPGGDGVCVIIEL